jgi:segregation and condensation protein B
MMKKVKSNKSTLTKNKPVGWGLDALKGNSDQLPLVQKETGPILSPEARVVEVILFLENEPVSLEKLMRMTGFSQEVTRQSIGEIKDHYSLYMHGLDISESLNAYQFVPSADLHEKLRGCYGKKVDRRLSKAALETLSIVAYSQPVTRREIDNIRGVTSDTIVRLLREREYIKVVGRKDVPGHPCLYGTSRKFLYEFNLSSISALPKLSDIDRERFVKENEENETV